MPYKGYPYYIFKVCILGQSAVGKTSLAKRLCFNTFEVDTKMTIGIGFYSFDLPIIVDGSDKFVRLSIWDFGGQEQFKKLFPYYIKGVSGAFMVFELVNLQSLIYLDWWWERLEEYKIQDIPKIIVGTKYDLYNSTDSKSKINDLIIQQFMRRHGEKDFVKTSSKDNYNVLVIFKSLVRKMLDINKLSYDKLP